MWLTSHLHIVTSETWIFVAPWLQRVDFCNESAVNVSWRYGPEETQPSRVQLSVVFNMIKSNRQYSKTTIMAGPARFNRTFETVVDRGFFALNEYYGVHLEYTTMYDDPSSPIRLWSESSTYRLFKMGSKSIPIKETELDVTDSSITVTLMWPKEIPFDWLHTNAQLNDRNTTLPIETVSNEKYRISRFRFENLLSATDYILISMFRVSYLPSDNWIERVEYKRTVRTRSISTSTSTALKVICFNEFLFTSWKIFLVGILSCNRIL